MHVCVCVCVCTCVRAHALQILIIVLTRADLMYGELPHSRNVQVALILFQCMVCYFMLFNDVLVLLLFIWLKFIWLNLHHAFIHGIFVQMQE